MLLMLPATRCLSSSSFPVNLFSAVLVRVVIFLVGVLWTIYSIIFVVSGRAPMSISIIVGRGTRFCRFIFGCLIP